MAESFSNYEGIQDNHQEEGKKIKTDQTLGSILNVQLNVENINTYADDAFNNLVAFAGQKVSDYKKITSIEGLSDKEIEDKAFKYYEIGDINSILDFIAEKAQEIRGLDGIIDRAANLKIVVVQPDAITPNLATGNGEFKEKKMIDRLKTVLFILKEDFDVDVNDEQQLSIEKGVIGDNMMRKTSYYLVNAPTIDRTLLICDEEGNASYVFNSKVLKEKEISNNQLIHFTKSELNDLIEETPELGRRVVYTKDGFVPRMIGSINNPVSTIPDEILPKSKDSASYLYPKASEGYLTAGAFARKNNIHPRTVSSVLDIIKDQLGNVEIYKSKNGLLSQGFSLEQQEIIFKQLEKEGKLIKPEPAPEGYFSKETLAKENNTSAETLSVVIDNIKSQLGYIGKYRFKNMDVLGYSPEQQKIIIDQLNKVVPEGYLSIKNIAENMALIQI